MQHSPKSKDDWQAVFRAIDRDVSEWTPDRLREAYIEHGCAVVRGAIDLETIAKVRAVTSDVYARSGDVHVYDPEIAAATGGAVSGFDLIAHPTLRRFLDLTFAGQGFTRDSATARRIKGSDGNANWQEPLSLHIDSYFHRFEFTVNFWVPFDACGVEAPGIQLLPVNYRDTRRHSGFSPRPIFEVKDGGIGNPEHFPQEYWSVEEIERAFGEGCMFHPVTQPGDVVIASNWIVHGSYRTAAMIRGRSSIEIRFIGRCPDIALKPGRADRFRVAARVLTNFVTDKLQRRTRLGLLSRAKRM